LESVKLINWMEGSEWTGSELVIEDEALKQGWRDAMV